MEKKKKIVSKKKVKIKSKIKSARFIVVKNRGYGKPLKGIKIYYEGKKPKSLKKDGSITFGKHILEALGRKFQDKFRWIITTEIDSITFERGIYRVRTSQKTLKRMGSELWNRTRDIKLDILANIFSVVYPEYFRGKDKPVYVPGTISRMLGGHILTRMSLEDREAMNNFLPEFIASESLNVINLLRAKTQIKTLKELAVDLADAIEVSHSEDWWQKFIKKNILIIQQGYIKPIEKMNTMIGGTKFPDFVLVTHDGYLDILEIKKPDTPILKADSSRGNYYWDAELTKAIIQTENYIEYVLHQADPIRNYIRDNYNIELKVLRPRGIILAGNTRKLVDGKEKDDFRLLSLSSKNITFVTYDELLSRLLNYIKVLEDYSI